MFLVVVLVSAQSIVEWVGIAGVVGCTLAFFAFFDRSLISCFGAFLFLLCWYLEFCRGRKGNDNMGGSAWC